MNRVIPSHGMLSSVIEWAGTTSTFNMPPVLLKNPKFHMGFLVITRNALSALSHDEYSEALQRHLQCDWGDLCQEDRNLNDLAMRKGGRLFSTYHAANRIKFWIITEADKSATTILLPEDH